MPDKLLPSGSPLTRKKYTSAFKAECVRQVAAGARQTDVARAQGLRFEPVLEIDMSITAVGFVQAELGIAVVDSLLPWAQFSGIRQCPLLDDVALPLSLLMLKARPLSRAETLMRDTIRKHKPSL